MEKYKIIRPGIEAGIWEQVKADLDNIKYPFVYGADIREKDESIFLNIEIDLGGGFESGYQATSLTAPVPIQFTTFTARIKESKQFRFALHDEDFIDKLGKFFGMEDIETGYAEFDKKIVVKTNDPGKVKTVFADETTRKVFQSLSGFDLHIAYYDHEDRHSSLELTIDRDITNVEELHRIYDAFKNVLNAFERINNPVEANS